MQGGLISGLLIFYTDYLDKGIHMFLPKYELKYTVPYDLYGYADRLIKELFELDLYGIYKLYKNDVFIKKYKNVPVLGFYHNSFRPMVKVSCKSNNEKYEIKFSLEINTAVRILLYFILIYLFAFLILLIAISIEDYNNIPYVFLPIGMACVSCLMTFIGYKYTARLHINAIKKIMSRHSCVVAE